MKSRLVKKILGFLENLWRSSEKHQDIRRMRLKPSFTPKEH